MRKIVPSAMALAIGAALLTVSAGTAYAQVTYTVTLTNLNHGQPLAPPILIPHNASFRLFTAGASSATPGVDTANCRTGTGETFFNNGGGLQYLAELGVPLCLADELTMTSLGDGVDRAQITVRDTNGNISIISSAVITGAPTTPPPFRTYRFTTAATKLTVATMLGITNDSFGAVTINLPSDGRSVDAVANAWDAGSECNDELPTHTGPFASQHPHDCAGEGTVSISNGFHNANHPANVGPSGTPGNIDWRNPVFSIHVTASDE
jgi:hypothetical protein